MRCALVFIIIFLVSVSAKRFETRCKLVRELIYVGMPYSFLGQWVCLAEKVSNRNTSAYVVSPGGKKTYGIFQIPGRWCKEGKKGGDCNVACASLLDENIKDDADCAQIIFNREGFKYWTLWTTRCKNDMFITTEIYKCPDLSHRRISPERDNLTVSETLRKRQRMIKRTLQRYKSQNNFGINVTG